MFCENICLNMFCCIVCLRYVKTFQSKYVLPYGLSQIYKTFQSKYALLCGLSRICENICLNMFCCMVCFRNVKTFLSKYALLYGLPQICVNISV